VCITSAIRRVHGKLRETIKMRGSFPSDEPASKLIWLALQDITANLRWPAKEWKLAGMDQWRYFSRRDSRGPRKGRDHSAS
jgi:transposase-like protein